MRRNITVSLIIFLSALAFLVYNLFTLITLLFDDGSADAIRAVDIPAPNSALIDTRTQIIPKIIHQTYKNHSIPAYWKQAQRSCIDLHTDYEYKVI